MLKEEIYVTEIKDKIKATALFYAENPENYPDSVIQADPIKFSIDDDLFFDVLLMEIRGKTISYSSSKKTKWLLPVNWQQRFYVKMAAAS